VDSVVIIFEVIDSVEPHTLPLAGKLVKNSCTIIGCVVLAPSALMHRALLQLFSKLEEILFKVIAIIIIVVKAFMNDWGGAISST
jgi:hypothetical protein